MAINRNDFLRLSAWGFIATLIPTHQINALAFITKAKSFDYNDYALAIQKAKAAKEHFLKKEYSQAEELYLECIGLAPADIRFYDNLQNVYGAQGLHLLSAELYKNGLSANPNKVAFYDRAARSLMRLELGYKTLANEYRQKVNSLSLLEDAKSLYVSAIAIDSKSNYLKIGKDKVEYKIQTNAIITEHRTDADSISRRMQRRRDHNKRYQEFTNEELLSKITLLDSKTRTKLYFENELFTRNKNIVKEKKAIYKILALRERENKNITKAIEHATSIYVIDNKDSDAINFIKQVLIESNNYSALVDFQKQHSDTYPNVYTKLGLMKALTLNYEYQTQNNQLLYQSIDIGIDLITHWPLVEHLHVKVISKLSESYSIVGNTENARTLLKEFIQKSTILSAGSINTLVHSYAITYYNTSEYMDARDVLLLGLKDFQKVSTDKFEYIRALSGKKTTSVFSTDLKLYHLLYEVYKKLNDYQGMDSILNQLLQNDPNDRFALKRT